MSLQCFQCLPPKKSQLATALKIACTIIPVGIALRCIQPMPLGSTAMLATGLLAMPQRVGLPPLAEQLLGCLSSYDSQRPPDGQPPTTHTLADRLWFNCGYRISVRY